MNDAFTWCLIAALLACLAGGMLVYSEREEGLPEESVAFQGRPVQAWLDDLRSEDRATNREALDVFATMGPENEDAVPELAKALEDPNPMVRAGAARGLGHIGPAARPALSALDSAAAIGTAVDLREMLQAWLRIEGSAKSQEQPPAVGEVR